MASERTQTLNPAAAGDDLVTRLVGHLPPLEHGELVLELPGHAPFTLGGNGPGPRARLHVRQPARLVRRFALRGVVGFAEGYIDGDWDTDDLATLLYLGALNDHHLPGHSPGARLARWIDHLRHRLRPNTRRGSRRNIAAHYDLGNDFYRLWLDPSMTYSSALYADPATDLETAQAAKYQRLLDRLGARPGDHILEIGCGWGGFAEHAARAGMRVTGITVSAEQLAYARGRIDRAGLADRVELAFCDYRDLDRAFDHVVSIEMFEAVGEAYWPTYFQALARSLRPGGRAALQVITIDEAHFRHYRQGADFIQLYIFPGGMLPSPERLHAEAGAAGLRSLDRASFGPDYARTLAAWQERFDARAETLAAMGFDARFRRMWRFYLAYCQAGFREGRLDLVQTVLTR